MTTQPQRKPILRWTTRKNLLTILTFTVIAIITQYLAIALTDLAATADPTAITIPAINISLSLVYHIIPATAIITLTACFVHLTTHTTTLTPKTLPKKPPPPPTRQKPARLRALRQFARKLQRGTRRIKQRILNARPVASLRRRINPAKPIIKAAITVTATFLIIMILVTAAAYPQLVPTATLNLYRGSTAFHGFVIATIKASQSIANTIPPIGTVAATINDALISASPSFRNSLEGVASSIAGGLVALSPLEKYLVTQNSAIWTTALATLLYSWYARTRRYRR
jgi:hypothetical protein